MFDASPDPFLVLLVTAAICSFTGWLSFYLGKRKSLSLLAQDNQLEATPDYYGWFAIIAIFAPPLLLFVVLKSLQLGGVVAFPGAVYVAIWVLLPLLLLWPVNRYIHSSLRAREICEHVIYTVLLLAAIVSILTTLGILLSVLFETFRFFQKVSPWEFFTGTKWAPGGSFIESAGRGGEQADSSFGAVPLFWGTILISCIAMCVAVPVGLMTATFLSEYATKYIRETVKPILEILAGIPTVVYGFFAATTVAPLIVQGTGFLEGLLNNRLLPLLSINNQPVALEASYQNALAPGLVMGIMIIPFMSSLCDDVMSSVPNALREASLALGATQAETIKRAVWPASLPGIISAILLSVSRAIGETMIVVMAAGITAKLTANPLTENSTVTVQIVYNLTGDLEYDNPQTLSAFALGFALLVFTLCLNIASSILVRRFKKRYEAT